MAGVRPRLPLEALVPGPAPVLPVEAAGLAGSAEAVPAALAAARAAVAAEASTVAAAAAAAVPAGDNKERTAERRKVFDKTFFKKFLGCRATPYGLFGGAAVKRKQGPCHTRPKACEQGPVCYDEEFGRTAIRSLPRKERHETIFSL